MNQKRQLCDISFNYKDLRHKSFSKESFSVARSPNETSGKEILALKGGSGFQIPSQKTFFNSGKYTGSNAAHGY